LNLQPEELRVLVQGGVVHDIGKLEVPDEILNKPGPLSERERKAIEAHTVAGYEMCARLGFMGEELGVIRSHHERLDGLGYPDGLKGEQIPLPARIMAVSDVWDALTSARAYRPAWSREEALEYMMQNRGTQFEPRLVNLWAELMRDEKKLA
jgi:HD-GYP domain-containing protein (c-di-GMP phosphodiesterase class II)